MTRFVRLHPGDTDHIKTFKGTEGQDMLECSVCGDRYDDNRDRHRRRMARTHWKHEHVKCKKGDPS